MAFQLTSKSERLFCERTEKVEKYIIRIRSSDENESVSFGTGIVIDDYRVLTARHVVCGQFHTLQLENAEIPLHIQCETESVAILISEQKLSIEAARTFSFREIMDNQSLWTVYGYITDQQLPHMVSGHGIIKQEAGPIEWNYTLDNIENGRAQNYRGLSGAPVFSRNRIVGILQVQEIINNGVLGLRMSNIEMIQDLLPSFSLQLNEYEELVCAKSTEFSRRHIEENKNSRKYIPDIFVEYDSYKEYLRYFADPVLFLKKTLYELQKMDFSEINQTTSFLGLSAIDPLSLPTTITPEQLEITIPIVSDYLSKTIYTLEEYEHRIRSKGLCWEEYYSFWGKVQNSLKYSIKELKEKLPYTKFQFLLLTQPAGQGKTNFLCDFTENFLLKKGYCVWYFNAYEFYEPPANILWQKLSLEGLYDKSYVKQVLERRWQESKRPLIIVIDGLNENIALPNFEQALIGFLQECETLPFIKVIMSTRDEMLEERFGQMLAHQNPEQFSHVRLNTHDDQFKERIFKGYLSFFNIDIRWDTLNERTYQQLTKDVLLLRFFCEVHQGTRQLYMYDVYKYAVFEQYCSNKAEEYKRINNQIVNADALFRTLLDRICEYMISTKTYFRIPIDFFDVQQQEMVKTLLENDVVFKGEGIFEDGLLKHPTIVISFTFDEFRDYCLTNYILRNSKNAESFLKFWTTMIDEGQTICEGIEKYTFYLSKTRNKDPLLPIIKTLPEYDDLYWAFIWDIEDKYIEEEDILEWKKELLQEGKNADAIVRHLIYRDDCTYFPAANILLIFDILNEYLKDFVHYTRFTKRMFGIPRKNKWGEVVPQTQTPVPFNEIVNYLERIATNPQLSQLHHELFRLSIYLYEIELWGTQQIWNQLYKVSPELSIQLLREMNQHTSSLILGNVHDILFCLEHRDDDYDLQILSLLEENNFGRGLSQCAFSISQLFSDDYEE